MKQPGLVVEGVRYRAMQIAVALVGTLPLLIGVAVAVSAWPLAPIWAALLVGVRLVLLLTLFLVSGLPALVVNLSSRSSRESGK